MFAVLILAVPARAVEIWDFEETCDGDFTLYSGWDTITGSSSHLNSDFKSKSWTSDGGTTWYPGGGSTTVGWLTSQGSTGGSLRKNWSVTKASGWTVEISMVILGTPTQGDANGILVFADDVDFIDIGFSADANGVPDELIFGQNWGTYDNFDPNIQYGPTVGDVREVFPTKIRIVRMPNSETIELYLNDDFSSPTAQLTTAPIGSGEGYFAVTNTILDGTSYDNFRYHSGATPPTPFYGDVNLDGFVGGVDMTRILANWGVPSPVYSQGDVSLDGVVGADDFNAVLNNWGAGTLPPEPPEAPGGGAIPEPSTLFLLAGGVLAGLIRRR